MNIKNALYLFLLSALWGPSFLFIKIAVQEIGPITLAGFRIGLAAVLLHIWLFIKGYEFNPSWQFWKCVTIAGFFAHALPFVLINWGEQYIDSSIASILNGLTPLCTLLIANFAIADEKMTVAKTIGTTLGFLGLILLVSPTLGSGLDTTTMGIIAVAVAALSYGVALVYSRLNLMQEKPLYAPSSQLLIATIYLIPLGFWYEGPIDVVSISGNTWGSILILGSFGTALAFLVYYQMLSSAGASYVSLVTYLMPIYGIALGIIYLDEQLYWQAIVGASMIIFGIVIANKTIGLPQIWKK